MNVSKPGKWPWSQALSRGMIATKTIATKTIATKAIAIGSSAAILLAPSVAAQTIGASPIENLQDGHYQLCSEPEPEDWHVGAGECLNIVKQGNQVSGYYGLPHSAEFVCISGQVTGNLLQGRGALLLWAEDIPLEEQLSQVTAQWQGDGRLSLHQGSIVQGSLVHSSLAQANALKDSSSLKSEPSEGESWAVFESTTLNLENLILYATPRMTAPAELCGG